MYGMQILHVRWHPHVPRNISSVLCYYRYLAENVTKSVYYNQFVSTNIIVMCFIGFIDLTNVGKNTKIKTIGVLKTEFLTKTYFVAAILKFQILSGNRWNDVVVPAIFEFSILKNPLGQIFMLLSRSAHVELKMLHISSTRRKNLYSSQGAPCVKVHMDYGRATPFVL